MKFQVINKKVILIDRTMRLVGDNEYEFLFEFDEEWEGKTKTARFVMGDYMKDIVLNDDKCLIEKTFFKGGKLKVGVYASNVATTVLTQTFKPSILEESGGEPTVPEDLWTQLLEIIDADVQSVRQATSDAQDIVDGFGDVVKSKQEEFNTYAAEKQTEFNKNAATKISEYDEHITDYTTEINSLKSDLTGLQTVVDSKADKSEFAKTNLYLDALYKLNKGQTWDTIESESEAYSVDVPSGSRYVGVDKVGGKSVVWNQLWNYEKTYTEAGVTYTYENHFYDIVKDTTSNNGIYVYHNFKPNDKYYVSFEASSNDNIKLTLSFGKSLTAELTESNKRYRNIITTNTSRSVIYLYSSSGVACTYRVGNIKVINLTQMFGAGNEPTIKEFEAMFPADYYPYNEGETISSHTDRVDVASADGTISQQIPTNFPVLNSAGSVYDYIDLNEGKLYTWTYIEGNEVKALTEPVITDIEIPTELSDWLTVEAGGSITFHNSDEGKRLLIPNKETFIRKLDEVTV